ncbi:MAG: hypothetical protein AB1898_23665 [Acidobacteriota bacterium]
MWYPDDPTCYTSYDSIARPNRLTPEGSSIDWVKDVVYGPANQRLEMKYWYGFINSTNQWYDETRTYNARLQLTNLVATVTSRSRSMLTEAWRMRRW